MLKKTLLNSSETKDWKKFHADQKIQIICITTWSRVEMELSKFNFITMDINYKIGIGDNDS